MKMKLALLLVVTLFLRTTTIRAQLATDVTLTNLQGKVYNNITIDHTNKLGVVWTGADGSMGQIKYNDLPMEYWVNLKLSDSAKKYDEAIALQQEQEQKARLAQAEATRQAAKQQAELNMMTQDMLTATNSKEMEIDAMVDNPTNMSPDEKSARDGLLKALLDISSSTSVGVNRNDYGTLLAKANSALSFARTKLAVERHGKFLLCAAKAVGYYSKANDEWSDYFKYDWEREQDRTYMSAGDFYDLRQNGLPVEASNYSKQSDGVFSVPFKESLNLYWEAADIYIHKMQRDAASLP
jgi:hypothetical protein